MYQTAAKQQWNEFGKTNNTNTNAKEEKNELAIYDLPHKLLALNLNFTTPKQLFKKVKKNPKKILKNYLHFLISLI